MSPKLEADKRNWTIVIASLLTVLVVAGWIGLLMAPVCSIQPEGAEFCHGTKWQEFYRGSASTIGDAVAGVAGTLALLWAIIAVILQGRELKETRSELARQSASLEKQLENAEEEKAWREVEVLLNGFRRELPTKPTYRLVKWRSRKSEVFLQYTLPSDPSGEVIDSFELDEFMARSFGAISPRCKNIIAELEDGGELEHSSGEGVFRRLHYRLKKVESLRRRISEDRREWLNEAKFGEWRDFMDRLAEPAFWSRNSRSRE